VYVINNLLHIGKIEIMNAISFYQNQDPDLNKKVFNMIDVKIQHADLELNKFVQSIMKRGQKPHRAPAKDINWRSTTEEVFSTIENSSLLTTKLLYLRANISETNNETILDLLINHDLEKISLDEIKERIA